MQDSDSILCSICGELFATKKERKVHLEKAHKNEELMMKCDQCNYTRRNNSQSAYLMKIHVRKHTGEKPELCKYCGVGFAAKKTLKTHERLHTGEKPYNCDQCPNSFTQYTGLKSHIQAHHKKETATT